MLQQKFKANKESEKDEAAEDAQKKELEGKQKVLKGLGSIAAAQLQAMKITEAEIITSSKVDANLLGDFHAARRVSEHNDSDSGTGLWVGFAEAGSSYWTGFDERC